MIARGDCREVKASTGGLSGRCCQPGVEIRRPLELQELLRQGFQLLEGQGANARLLLKGEWCTAAAEQAQGQLEFAFLAAFLPSFLGSTTRVTGTQRNDGISGSAGHDTLLGTSFANDLFAAAGSDTLSGNSGNDGLDGGVGVDVLTGGIGADTFIFRFQQSQLSNPDPITDFAIGADKIGLLSASGTAAPLASVVAAVFTDANGATAGLQPLAINRAALVVATAPAIAGSYLVINDAVASFQPGNDLTINTSDHSGVLPAGPSAAGGRPPHRFPPIGTQDGEGAGCPFRWSGRSVAERLPAGAALPPQPGPALQGGFPGGFGCHATLQRLPARPGQPVAEQRFHPLHGRAPRGSPPLCRGSARWRQPASGCCGAGGHSRVRADSDVPWLPNPKGLWLPRIPPSRLP